MNDALHDDDFRINTPSIQEEVLNRLRDEIIRGVWKPGVRLQERILCERFGISRSPLREAYQVLATEGLLDLLRNRGAVVTTPTLKEVLDNHKLLLALECLGIELACEEATDAELDAIKRLHEKENAAAESRDGPNAFNLNNELHRAIVVASHNKPLIESHLIASRQIIRVQNATGFLYPDIPSHEHDVFVEALLARKKGPAAKGLRQHLEHVESNLRRRLQSLKDASSSAERLSA